MNLKQIKKDIQPLVKLVKIGHDFLIEQEEMNHGIRNVLLTQISEFVNSLFDKTCSDADMVGEFVKMEDIDEVLSEVEIEQMILEYVYSESFKNLR